MMEKREEIRVSDAKRVCQQYGYRGVVILAFDGSQVIGASYGETKNECGQLGRFLDKVIGKIVKGELPVWNDWKPQETVQCTAGRGDEDDLARV